MVDQAKLDSTIFWLIAGAPPPKTIEGVVTESAERIVEMGVPLSAFVVNGFFVHPQIRGIRNSWTQERGYKQQTFDHSFMDSPAFQNTPLADMLRNPREMRYRFNDRDREKASLYRAAYKNLGYTDLLLVPLINVDGTVTGNLEMATKQNGGFSQPEYDALLRLRDPIARIKEYYTERFDKNFTLSTYLGHDISRKVLKGQIVLGNGETISAVVLFADVIGFTELSNNAPFTEVSCVLNQFFSAIDKAVVRNDGEILKFIGDGVLAIFPTRSFPGAHQTAAEAALAAVSQTRQELASRLSDQGPEFRAALHTGEVFYGNIGSGNRLDFTAIGPTVNLASRMLSEASKHGAKTVCSAAFRELTTSTSADPIKCHFKGFSEPTNIFALG